MEAALTANWVLVFKLLGPLWCGPPQGMDPRTKATLADADAVLAGLWRAACTMTRSSATLSPPRTARVKVDGRESLALCMPATTQSPDAYFVLSALVGGKWRCITLERVAYGEGAMLAEVLPGGSHGSYGLREGPITLTAFLMHCSELLGVPIEHVEGPLVRLEGQTQTPEWVYLLGLAAVVGVFVGLTFLL